MSGVLRPRDACALLAQRAWSEGTHGHKLSAMNSEKSLFFITWRFRSHGWRLYQSGPWEESPRPPTDSPDEEEPAQPQSRRLSEGEASLTNPAAEHSL